MTDSKNVRDQEQQITLQATFPSKFQGAHESISTGPKALHVEQ